MKTSRSFTVSAVCGIITILFSSQLKAASLDISNHSFESFVLSDGTFSQPTGSGFGGIPSANPIPAWTISGNAGSWNNTSAELPPGTTEGVNTAWLHSATIQQTLIDVLVAGTYTLSVDAGFTIGGGSPGYRTSLLAGSTLLAQDNNMLVLPFGSLATSTIQYIAGQANPFLGQPLTIRIQSLGVETVFDNVRLSVVPIPEPATYLLLVVGLTVLLRRVNARTAHPDARAPSAAA